MTQPNDIDAHILALSPRLMAHMDWSNKEIVNLRTENKRLRTTLLDLRHGIFASEQAVNDCIDKALEEK